LTEKEFNLKKMIEKSPKFEDLSIEEQWDLMYFMLSIVTDPEALEIIEFLLNQLKKTYEFIRGITSPEIMNYIKKLKKEVKRIDRSKTT
jgi:hypothetical protein